MDRAAIKAQARQLNKGNTLNLFLVVFVVWFVSGGINMFISFRNMYSMTQDILNDGYGYASFGFGGSLLGILSIVMIPVGVALSGYFVKFIRGQRASAGEGIGYCFKNGFGHFGRYFSATFVTGLMIFLWALIPFVGWVFAIIAYYRYYFVAQIVHDNPELTGGQARELSRKMTDGVKGELFVMELSFLGWIILTSFTFGILYIYVGPYMETTKALYYENLRIRAIQAGIVNEQNFMPYQNVVQTDVYGNPISPYANGYGQQQPPMPMANNGYPQPPVQNFNNQVPNYQPNPNPVPQQQPIQNPVAGPAAPSVPVNPAPAPAPIQEQAPVVPPAEDGNGPEIL